MISTSRLLQARADAALALLQFDSDAREAGKQRIVGLAAKRRQKLIDNLHIYGGAAWKYSPDTENSWVTQ